MNPDCDAADWVRARLGRRLEERDRLVTANLARAEELDAEIENLRAILDDLELAQAAASMA